MVLNLTAEQLKEKLKNGEITVAVYGLGNVGLPLALAWMEAGASVVGVDIDEEKVLKLNDGESTTDEPGVSEGIRRFRASGKFEAMTNAVDASRRTQVKLVVVPTLLDEEKRFEGSALLQALREVGSGLKRGDLVSIECSVPPGFTETKGQAILEEESGLEAEEGFGLCASPERIYVGRALEDIRRRYPKVVGGVGERSTEALAALYEAVAERGVVRMSSATAAEASKLFEGVYRDANIALANELAKLCQGIGVDYMEVREAANSQPFCHLHDPGCGVGGVCLPYYPYFIVEVASEKGIDLPLILTARGINEGMPRYTLDLATQAAEEIGIDLSRCKVAVMGLAYRGGVSDARNSPSHEVARLFQQLAASVVVHDPLISRDEDLWQLSVPIVESVEEAFEDASVVFFATDHEEYQHLDLMRLAERLKEPAIIVDSRAILKSVDLPPSVRYLGLGRGNMN